MSDNALMTMSTDSLLSELQGLGPQVSAPQRLQLASIRVLQSMSDDVKEGKAKAGDFVITFGADSVQEPIYTSVLRVMVIDTMQGRVMWKLKPDGSKDMSAKKPSCGSNNTVTPRLGEMFEYVGQTHSDYRRSKDGDIVEWTITETCQDCPFSKFIPAYQFDRKTGQLLTDENGKALVDRKPDGKPRMLKPPCNVTESHVVYLIDFGFPAILRASSPTVRIGLKKLPDYFAPAANGQRPFIKDGQPHCLEIKSALKEYAGNGSKTYVPEAQLSADPVSLDMFGQYVALLKRYNEEEVRKALTSSELTLYDNIDPEAEYADDEEAAVNVGMDTSTAKSKLGANGKGKRRIADEDTENPFGDE